MLDAINWLMAKAERGPQRTEEERRAEVKRVTQWRENNRESYNAYKRNYNKQTGKAREDSKRRYHENEEEARRQARERQRRHREKQKQQQSGEVFPLNRQ